MKAKPTLKVVARPESDNPLVDTGCVSGSLDNMEAYAVFLCVYLAQESGGDPSEQLRHGQYLAMRVLADALAVVGQEEKKEAA